MSEKNNEKRNNEIEECVRNNVTWQHLPPYLKKVNNQFSVLIFCCCKIVVCLVDCVCYSILVLAVCAWSISLSHSTMTKSVSHNDNYVSLFEKRSYFVCIVVCYFTCIFLDVHISLLPHDSMVWLFMKCHFSLQCNCFKLMVHVYR